MWANLKWSCYLWYFSGIIFLALPGFITVDNRLYYFILLGIGWIIVVYALRKNEFLKPSTAIILMLVSNIAFWLSYGLWKLRIQIIGPIHGDGIDPFGIAISVWLVTFIIVTIYEIVVLSRGLFNGHQRRLSLLGLLGVILQYPITVMAAYAMIIGV